MDRMEGTSTSSSSLSTSSTSAIAPSTTTTTSSITGTTPSLFNNDAASVKPITANSSTNNMITSTKEIVQEKFLRGETVIALLESYQIIGCETPNRLLVLVSSSGTYAIFSFAASCLPPLSFSDLTVDNIFKIDELFEINTDSKGKIAKFQFEIISSSGRSTFYYYPYSSTNYNDFNAFHKIVKQIQLDVKSRYNLVNKFSNTLSLQQKQQPNQQQNTNFYCYTNDDLLINTNDNGINDTISSSSSSLSTFSSSLSHLNNSAIDNRINNENNATQSSSSSSLSLDFSWLNSYIREDCTDIDRKIADGSKPLKKGESKFQDELKKHEHEYIVYKKYKVYCATWNINGQACCDQTLHSWLSNSEEPPDIYAVALQELDLSPKAITFSESRPDPVWIRKIMDSLHPGAKYEELVSVRLVGMMLTIIVKKELRRNVTRCWTQTVGTGALNFMGNKGGVGVSMTLNETDICFVNSHLAAHVHEVDRRNEDFAEIMKRLIFDENLTRRTIENHDLIFWIGDLNYRVNEFPGIQLDYNNLDQLYKYDQLRREMLERHVFDGFIEGDVKFRPTYKYDPGTDNWDSSEKCRAPAWCDRILWKGDRIEQLVYNSVMDIRLSDHKPVYGIFLAGIKTKDEQKYKRIHEEVLKRVDKYENDNQPQITVEKTDIDFGIIQFNEKLIRDFTVANNCHLPVKFSFKPKNEIHKEICEKWIEVEPKEGNLITGTSLSIRIKVLIDSNSVQKILTKQREQCGKIPLDILVLHVEDGRDIFITIMGEYKPSCFGLPLDTLCCTDKPISEYTLSELLELEKSFTDLSEYKVTMPREIFLLIDYLYTNGKNYNSLFSLERRYRKNPNLNQIRDWLDTWSSEEFPGTPYIAAETLLMFLESLPEPILHPYCESILSSETYDQVLNYISQLSKLKRNIFMYISMYLRNGIEEKQFNIHDIGTIFGQIFLKGCHIVGYRDERSKTFMTRFLKTNFNNSVKSIIK